MFKKFLEYIKYRKNLKELNNNYIAVFCPYKGVQLCDPVEIYKKGQQISEDSFPNPERYLKKSVLEGIDAAIAGTSAISLMSLERNDKLLPFIKKLYKFKLNGKPELILDYV